LHDVCAPAITVKQRGLMPKTEEAWTQLATRIPKELHRRLKLHSVTNDVTVMDFVIQAIEEMLGRKAKKRKA
jgi:predicted HicB family RNase H-like nuclease